MRPANRPPHGSQVLFATSQDKRMIANSRTFAVSTAVAALVCGFCIIAATWSPLQTTTVLKLPTGLNSPEGVACDLIRAHISEDAVLFHDSRCKVSCENAFDATSAYDSLLRYKPIALNVDSEMLPKSPDELTITKASIRPDAPQPPDSSWDQRRVSLFCKWVATQAQRSASFCLRHYGWLNEFDGRCWKSLREMLISHDPFFEPQDAICGCFSRVFRTLTRG
jgi:hypothetical protein